MWDFNAPLYAAVLERGQAFTFERHPLVIARHGAPEEAFVRLSHSAVLDDAGTRAGVLVTVTETTSEVRAQPTETERAPLAAARDAERTGLLEEVFRRAPSFLHVLRGPDFIFELANEAYRELVGREDLIGRPAFEALPEAAAGGFAERIARVLATGEPFVGRELPVTLARRPGATLEERLIDLEYLPLYDADGTRTRVLGYGADVTEQVRARRATEAALAERTSAAEEARAAAEAAGRLKSEFLATMSHEFRTPLNAILGYAQLLDMGILGATTPEQNAHLERLQTSARHLLQLVNDVLDVAKVDAERMRVQRDVLATGAAVAAALALVQPQATAKGIRVENHGAGGAVVPYLGDEHRVRQILVNLLANAVKFTHAGGAVGVSCEMVARAATAAAVATTGDASPLAMAGDAARWAVIRVADTGPGIAPELLGRLFEPFTQGDAALTRTHGGTGLGLAISRRLARLMGGDITVENRPGDGAAFTLWLPTPNGAAAPDRVDVDAAARRRTPVGMPAIAVARATEPAQAPPTLDAAAYAVLHAIGTRLADDAEPVAARYVAALRADPRLPGARELPAAQLRNHATPLVGLVATQLMTIGETRGRAPELLRDGAELQGVLAELHGAQRYRLGWAEADLERELPVLRAEMERVLAAAPRPVVEVDAGGDAREAGVEAAASGVDPAVVDAAVRYAIDVVRERLEQARRTALRAYQVARTAATP